MGASRHGQGLTVFTVLSGVVCGLVYGMALGCQGPARVVQTVLDPLEPDAETALPVKTQPQQTLGPKQQPPLVASQQSRSDGTLAAASCPDSLNDRVTLRTIDLPRDVRYKQLGFENFPFDERVGFSASPDGHGYIAWTDDSSGRVFVTPLNQRWERGGADIDAKSWEVGGIVAHDDGYALLTLRDDQPPPQSQGGSSSSSGSAGAGASGSGSSSFRSSGNYVLASGPVVTLVRYRNGMEDYAAALTGPNSVTQKIGTAIDDYGPGFLYGRLAWNGARYGAYFIIGINSGPQNTDKLVYADDAGNAVRGGFDSKCTSNQGLRLWPELDAFTPVCVSDSQPSPGVNLVLEDQPPVLLAAEASAPGWSGGQMGSVVKMPGDNTYFVGWLSRDVVPGGAANQTARMASDIALVRLGPDRKVIGEKRWLVETADVAETNLHLALYGTSQILVVWDAITDLRCDKMCFGTYAGTYARVLDREGNVINGGRLQAVPNHHDDLVTLPNGDVAWAFVPDPARDYRAVPPSRDNVVLAPSKRTIQVARLRYCE